MLGTLTPEQKKECKNHVSAMVHAYNCTRNAATGFSPYYLLIGREPRLPVDVEFGLQKGSQKGPLGESGYVSQLRRQLKFAHKKAKLMASRQQARYKGLYDRKCRSATLDIGDLVLVKQTAWKGRHKIQDHWEEEEYQVVDQPIPGVPVYVVNVLLEADLESYIGIYCCPCKEGLDKRGVTGRESSPDSEIEGETHEATKATHGRPRGTSHVNSTKKRGDPVHLSGDGQPTLTSLSSPEHMKRDEDSSEDEEYITPSTPVDSPPSTTEAMEDDRQSAAPELFSDISSIAQPSSPDQTITDMDIEHEQEHESDEDSESDSDSD